MTALAVFADCCPKCDPLDLDEDSAVLPTSVTEEGNGSLRADYGDAPCGHQWQCWWNPETVDGWPLRRAESAA